MPLRSPSSAHVPADAYVLAGCIAVARYVYRQNLDAASFLLLLKLAQDDDQELTEDEVAQVLGVKRLDAQLAMSKLARRGLVEHRAPRDEAETITLNEAGQMEAMAILGAVMLAGSPADKDSH